MHTAIASATCACDKYFVNYFKCTHMCPVYDGLFEMSWAVVQSFPIDRQSSEVITERKCVKNGNLRMKKIL